MEEILETKINGSVAFMPGGLQLKDAAKYIGVSTVTVRRLVQRGLIRPNRAIRHLIFARSELDRFLNQ